MIGFMFDTEQFYANDDTKLLTPIDYDINIFSLRRIAYKYLDRQELYRQGARVDFNFNLSPINFVLRYESEDNVLCPS